MSDELSDAEVVAELREDERSWWDLAIGTDGVFWQLIHRLAAARREVREKVARLTAELNAAADATGLAGVDEPLSLLDAVAQLRAERDRLAAENERLTGMVDTAGDIANALGAEIERVGAERDAALRERDEARVSTTLLHHVRIARAQERRWAAGQVRAADLVSAGTTTNNAALQWNLNELVDRIAAGPRPGEEG